MVKVKVNAVEGNYSVQPQFLSNTPRLYNFYRGTADQNWFSVVFLQRGIPVYTYFPCLMIFSLHNFQNWDCLCILAHTFGIGLLLLMDLVYLLSSVQ